MKTMLRYAASTAMLFMLGVAAGCGGEVRSEARSPAAEPPPPPAPAMLGAEAGPAAPETELTEPTTLADAEKLLEKARVDFDRLALSTPTAPAPAPAAAPRSSMPQPAPRDEARRADKAASSASTAGAPPSGEGNGCQTACRAYASLSRASEAVCRLDAEDGKRCERARQIREEASRRVALCGCTQ